MTKETSVWALKLNPVLVELRAANGPIKIIRSNLTKPTTKSVFTGRYMETSPYDAIYRDVKTKVTLSQTSIVGGRSLGVISLNSFRRFFLGVSFANTDLQKLNQTYAKIALNLTWRRNNTK
jgi:hypothetical protein